MMGVIADAPLVKSEAQKTLDAVNAVAAFIMGMDDCEPQRPDELERMASYEPVTLIINAGTIRAILAASTWKADEKA